MTIQHFYSALSLSHDGIFDGMQTNEKESWKETTVNDRSTIQEVNLVVSNTPVMSVNSTNVQYEGLRIGGVGRRMNPKVKSAKQGVYQK
jgi:hypothetical protein